MEMKTRLEELKQLIMTERYRVCELLLTERLDILIKYEIEKAFLERNMK